MPKQMTKQYYESLSDKERTLLLIVISTDNLLRGMPTFQEYCAAQQSAQVGEGRFTMEDYKIYIGWAFDRHCQECHNADFEVCQDIACQVAVKFEQERE